MASNQWVLLILSIVGRNKGITDDFLKLFWRRPWVLDMPEKIKVWL